ncbi:MAG: ATP synthase F1 subunit delta [Bacillota bacterium]
MKKNELAGIYSRALLEMARDKDALLEYRDELNEVWQLIQEHEDLHNALFHHRILPGDKKRILRRLFAGELREEILNFLYLLVDKRRIYFLEAIVEDFNRRANKAARILTVEVETAFELPAYLKQKLLTKLRKILDYDIKIETRVNPHIIAGVVLKAGNHVLDGSLRNRLNSLQTKIENIPVSELGVE